MENATVNNSTADESPSLLEATLTRWLKFGVLLAFEIPSLLCSLFIFFCFVRERELRMWQNHSFILISVCNFLMATIELPVTLSFFRTGHAPANTAAFCFYWIFANYTLTGVSLYLMAVASMERYILIFWTRHLHSTILRRQLVHYFPLAFALILPSLWYAAVVLFFPCRPGSEFDYKSFVCGGACYQSSKVWATIDWTLSSFTPVFMITAFNGLLLAQVLWEKRHIRQALTWRKTRKMVIQLSATVFLYLITQLPVATLSIIGLLGTMSENLTHITLVWLYYLPYFIYLLSPFAYVLTTKQCLGYLRRTNNHVNPTNRTHGTLWKITLFHLIE